jgi:hypothetical protein
MKTLNKVLPVSFIVAVLTMLSMACATPPSSVSSPSGASSIDQIQGKEWKLSGVKVGGIDTGYSRDKLGTDFAQAYTLRFYEGLAAGRGAPNTYRAPFQFEANQGLSIGLVAATLMAPLREPEGLKEREYFGYLSKVSRWDINGGNLELLIKGEDGKDVVLIYTE